MSQDKQRIIPMNNRTVVRKLTSENAPKKVGGLLLPNDKNSEALVRCEVISSPDTDMDDYLTPQTVVVEADKLTRSVSVQGGTVYIIENKDILGIIVKD